MNNRERHWTDGLMRNSRGVPLGNLRNVLYALRHAPEWKSVLGLASRRQVSRTRRKFAWPPSSRRMGSIDAALARKGNRERRATVATRH
jgi:hypothetical protein